MKKFKILSKLSIGLIAVSPISLILTSCSNNIPTNEYSKLVPILKADAIEQFKKIAVIPRPTNHLNKIRTYLINLIQSKGYAAQRDDYGNIWFDVPANNSKYKDYPKLILQGHMDMVFAYDPNKFESEPDPTTYEIEVDETIDKDGKPIIISKDNKTSLGADDGVGLSIALSCAFNDNINHGPLRILITADEESGIRGSSQLNPIALDSDYLINLDGEADYNIIVSAKGAAQGEYSKTVNDITEIDDLSGKHIYRILVQGLAGGHSGVDIVDGRTNAIVEINKIITNSAIDTDENEIKLLQWLTPGVTAPTSITPISDVIIQSNNDISSELDTICENAQTQIRKVKADENALVKKTNITQLPPGVSAFYSIGREATKNMTKLISDLKYGVIVKGTSQTVGPITWDINIDAKKTNIFFKTYSRTDKDENIDLFVKDDKQFAEDNGFVYSNPTKYYPWTRNDNDKITKILTAAYKNFGHEPIIEDCNGGLEPTWFKKKRPTINVASIGPRLFNCHKYTETFYVESLDSLLESILYSIDHIVEYK